MPVPLAQYAQFVPGRKEMSTTMAFVRLLDQFVQRCHAGSAIVPIVADEARTLAWPICSSKWAFTAPVSKYAPEDIGSILAHREARDGQNPGRGHQRSRCPGQLDGGGHQLQRAMAWPCCRFISTSLMFGRQRVGDIWAVADQRARAF